MSRCYRIVLVLLSLALIVLSAAGTDPIQVLLASILGGWVVLLLGSWMWIGRLREAAAGRPRRPLGRETAAAAVALLLIASIATTHWPLRHVVRIDRRLVPRERIDDDGLQLDGQRHVRPRQRRGTSDRRAPGSEVRPPCGVLCWFEMGGPRTTNSRCRAIGRPLRSIFGRQPRTLPPLRRRGNAGREARSVSPSSICQEKGGASCRSLVRRPRPGICSARVRSRLETVHRNTTS